MIPAAMLDRWRTDARTVLSDPASTPGQRDIAWRFLSRWRL